MEEPLQKTKAATRIADLQTTIRKPQWSQYWVLLLSVVYFLIFASFTPGFAAPENIANIFSNLLPLLVVAIGQTFVLIAGGIDLSVTSIIGLSSVSGAMLMSRDGGWLAGNPGAMIVGVMAMLAIGAMVGWLNGLAITWLKMPAFIVTLTTMMFFSGLAIWLTKSKTIYNLPASFNAIGKGAVFLVPIALLVTLALALIAHTLLSRTLFGRWLYAVGHNVKAAGISGIKVNLTITLAYVMSGLCAALAAILYTGRMETGSPVMGQKILLDVIGAAVIGGTSLFGGHGKILWTVFGVLFITLIDNSLNMLGLSYFTIMMVKGGVILLSALLDRLRTK